PRAPQIRLLWLLGHVHPHAPQSTSLRYWMLGDGAVTKTICWRFEIRERALAPNLLLSSRYAHRVQTLRSCWQRVLPPSAYGAVVWMATVYRPVLAATGTGRDLQVKCSPSTAFGCGSVVPPEASWCRRCPPCVKSRRGWFSVTATVELAGSGS